MKRRMLPILDFLILGLNVLSCIKGFEAKNEYQFWINGSIAFMVMGIIAARTQDKDYKTKD